MPWCPKCGSEYRPEFDTCADCGTALVEGSPGFSDEPVKPDAPVHPVATILLSLFVALLAVVACGIAWFMLGPFLPYHGWIDNAFPDALIAVSGLTGFLVGTQCRRRLTTVWVVVGWALPYLSLWCLGLPSWTEGQTLSDAFFSAVWACLFLVSITLAGAVGMKLGSESRRGLYRTRILLFALAVLALTAYFTFAHTVVGNIERHVHA